jgi:hypothetical protein
MARIVIATAASPDGLAGDAGRLTSLAERARLESAFALVRQCLEHAVERAREEPA